MAAKFILRLGERWGVTWANKVICVSSVIAESVKKKFNVEVRAIPNGVVLPEAGKTGDSPQKAGTVPVLQRFGVERRKYILAVGRFVPEKGFRELIEAFKQGQSPKNRDSPCFSWKLAIAGDADHEDKYSQGLKELAKKTPGVVLTGFLSGQALQELYSHAGLFVLPSYYEGLPIVLLEAMSYGLSCLASDIPANRNVDLPQDRLFKPGDIQELAEKIICFIDKPLTEDQKAAQIRMIAKEYDWERIAEETLEVYKQIEIS